MNQPAPEKCCPRPGCRSTDRDIFKRTRGNVWGGCTPEEQDPWHDAGHGVLPVEPQPMSAMMIAGQSSQTMCSADIGKQTFVAVETVPVVPPASRSIQHSEGSIGGAPSFCAGNREPEPVKDGYSPAQSPVVPQGAEQPLSNEDRAEFDGFEAGWKAHAAASQAAGEQGGEDEEGKSGSGSRVRSDNANICANNLGGVGEDSVGASSLSAEQFLVAVDGAGHEGADESSMFTWEATVAAMRNYATHENAELKAQIARYEALDQHLPEGYAIGDDATAHMAVELVRAERERDQAREALREGKLFALLLKICRNAYACSSQQNTFPGESDPCGECANCMADEVLGENWKAAVPPSEDAPQVESRSFLRRKGAMRGEPALEFGVSEDAPATPQPLKDAIGKALRQLEKLDVCDGIAAKLICAKNAKHVLAGAWLDILKDAREPAAQPAPNDQAYAPDNPVHVGVAIEQARIGQCSEPMHTLCGLCVTGDCMEGIDSCQNDACDCMDCGGKSGLGFKLKKRYAAAQPAGKQTSKEEKL